MTRVLTQGVLVLFLASSLGAAPGQKTSDSRAKKDTPKSQAATTARESVNKAAVKPVKASLAVQVPNKAEAKPYQVGNASWYGQLFQGKETASGEMYDMYGFTAAHKELPLGTWVKVTNLRNDRTVIVRINDRGPVTPGRVLDLSYRAAKELNMAGRGVVKVRIDVIPSPVIAPTGQKPTVLEAGIR